MKKLYAVVLSLALISVAHAHYFDVETGLDYNMARDYDPATGRYVESDPIGLLGGINTYAYVNSHVTSLIDPLGLWGTQAHNRIIVDAFPLLDPALVQAIEQGSYSVDSAWSHQILPGYAYQHAMRDPNESVADAKQKACSFIKQHLASYQAMMNSNDSDARHEAYVELGIALHPIMDSTSPVHSGWQVWDPLHHPYDSFVYHGDAHGSKEGLDSLTKALEQQTINLIKSALNGNACACTQ